MRRSEMTLSENLHNQTLKYRSLIMPMGKGTYGSKKGRPPMKNGKKMNKGLSKLPAGVRKKILGNKKK